MFEVVRGVKAVIPAGTSLFATIELDVSECDLLEMLVPGGEGD